MSKIIKLISYLSHPFLMPFYSFSVFFGMERKAYYHSTLFSVLCYLSAFSIFVVLPYAFSKILNISNSHLNLSSENIKNRLTIFSVMLITYIFAFFIFRPEQFSSSGIYLIFILFCILTIFELLLIKTEFLNDFSFFCGGLSGFIIILGKTSGAEIFWSFIFSFFIFTLSSFAQMYSKNIGFSKLILSYLIALFIAHCFLLFC